MSADNLENLRDKVKTRLQSQRIQKVEEMKIYSDHEYRRKTGSYKKRGFKASDSTSTHDTITPNPTSNPTLDLSKRVARPKIPKRKKIKSSAAVDLPSLPTLPKSSPSPSLSYLPTKSVLPTLPVLPVLPVHPTHPSKPQRVKKSQVKAESPVQSPASPKHKKFEDFKHQVLQCVIKMSNALEIQSGRILKLVDEGDQAAESKADEIEEVLMALKKSFKGESFKVNKLFKIQSK